MRSASRSALGLACALAVVLGAPGDARACGGCFRAPSPTPSRVLAHRMVVVLSTRGTTLFDQVQFTGTAEEFVWILPVFGTPEVAVADDAFFGALGDATDVVLVPPPAPRTRCPAPGSSSSFGCGGSSESLPMILLGDGGAAADAGPPVTVYSEAVVGPYETATVGSSDPMALVAWLDARGYLVPDEILPTIAHYTELGASFVALRLAPGEGVDRMQPVRVTSPGLGLTFPLRMVAAGVQRDVALELFVFAEGRMETESFGHAEVDREALSFDWRTRTFDYDARFSDALYAGGADRVGTNWVTEVAMPAPMERMRGYSRRYADGLVHDASAELALVALSLDAPYLTRLRTSLPRSELDRDLVLRASAGGDLSNRIVVTRSLNRAPDVYCGEGGDCSAGPRRGVRVVVFGLALGPAALLLVRRSRPRRRRG